MVKKILVVAAAGIGDCLIATPLIHELRSNFPEADLHALVVYPGSRELLEGNPHLNVIHQRDLVTDSLFSSLRYLWGLRRQRFDLSINAHPQGRIHYRILAKIVGARLRVSHAYENTGWWDRFLVDRTVPQDYTVHSVENNVRLLPLVGAKSCLLRRELELFLTPAEEKWAQDFVAGPELIKAPRLGVHIGSGATKNLKLKRWPFGHWLELLRRLAAARPDLALLLFGGPQEQREHAEILEALRGKRVFAPKTSNLRQAAALLRHCHAFLSVDTALMHLAAARKVPNQLVIEAPTLNPTNVPWGNAYRLIPNVAIGGRHLSYYCYDGGPMRGTEEELRGLMASVTVDSVEAVVRETLG